MIELDAEEPGVYMVLPSGDLALVHGYEGGRYGIADIVEFFELGELLEVDGPPGIELDAKEILRLREMIKEYGSDHPEEFVAMCRSMIRAAVNAGDDVAVFYTNF